MTDLERLAARCEEQAAVERQIAIYLSHGIGVGTFYEGSPNYRSFLLSQDAMLRAVAAERSAAALRARAMEANDGQ